MFFRLRTALENTIPDLLRKCKRDILPLENVPKTNAHFFLHHRSLQDTRGSKGRIPFLIEERYRHKCFFVAILLSIRIEGYLFSIVNFSSSAIQNRVKSTSVYILVGESILYSSF
jgi:hypothetical protein